MSSPSSGSKNKPRKKPALLVTCFMLVSFLAYSSTLKIEAACFSETSVDFQRTTRRYIPEDRPLYFLAAFPEFSLRVSVCCRTWIGNPPGGRGGDVTDMSHSQKGPAGNTVLLSASIRLDRFGLFIRHTVHIVVNSISVIQ
jgi:hypothetical protein